MAMTKKEREEMERLRSDAEMYRALRWSDGEPPKPMRVEWLGGKLQAGWFVNEYKAANLDGWDVVSLGCSNGASHSRSRTDKTESQGAGVLYGPLHAYVECKSPEGRATPEQLAFRDAVVARGDEWHEVRSLEQMQGIVEEWQRRGVLAPVVPVVPPRPADAAAPAALANAMGGAKRAQEALRAAQRMERAWALARLNEREEAGFAAREARDREAEARESAARRREEAAEAKRELMELVGNEGEVQSLGDGRVLMVMRVCGNGRR